MLIVLGGEKLLPPQWGQATVLPNQEVTVPTANLPPPLYFRVLIHKICVRWYLVPPSHTMG